MELTTKSIEYRNALKAARSGGPLAVKHVAALFGVSESMVNKWANLYPQFHAYRRNKGVTSAWCFPVSSVEDVLGFKIR